MSTEMLIYLIGVYAKVCGIVFGCVAIAIAIWLVTNLISVIFDDDDDIFIKTFSSIKKKIPIKLCMVLIILSIFLPSKSDLMMMYIVPKIEKNVLLEDNGEILKSIKDIFKSCR